MHGFGPESQSQPRKPVDNSGCVHKSRHCDVIKGSLSIVILEATIFVLVGTELPRRDFYLVWQAPKIEGSHSLWLQKSSMEYFPKSSCWCYVTHTHNLDPCFDVVQEPSTA